jgi:glycosyltransferase involved in cell wall biosynthesis
LNRVEYPLHVLHIDSADEYRGGQNQVRTLVAGLRRFPHVRQLVAAPVGAPLLEEVEALAVPVASLRWTSPADIRGMHGLARLLRGHWDVLHAHDSHALQLALIGLGLTGAGTRVVASRRVSFPIRSPAVWRRADLVLAVSSSVRNSLLEKGLERRRVRVVHDGVDPVSRPCPRPGALRNALGMDGTRPLVGALGALDRQKDHATFLRAAAAAIRTGESEATYAVFGEGPERARLESVVAELGLDGRFLLPGHIPNAAASLGDLDVFVMCSTVEGLGSSALEAIAAGVPAVLTAGGGLTDVAGEIPVIPPGDHQALADSLARLLADAVARAERRAAGLARARSFTAARMVERTLQCYEVLATHPAESAN